MEIGYNSVREMKNIAYIDGANLYEGVKDLGWVLDYYRFRIWLKDKFDIQTAYIFIGLVPAKKDLYTRLQEAGFVLVYKEVTYDGTGKVKGNCDADLVLKIITDYFEKRVDKIIIVSSDGDYSGLVKFLRERNVFQCLVSPSNNCSFLLRKLNIPIIYLDTQKNTIKQDIKRKSPR
jgi:uncharacterized LabA/DUF88 family protein